MLYLILLIVISNSCLSYCQHKSSFESADESDHNLHHNQIPPPYQQPSAEEIENILKHVYDNELDKDKNGLVNEKELKSWIEIVHDKLIKESVERQWTYYEPDFQEVHSWEGYKPETKEVLRWERYVNLTYPDDILEKDDSDPQVQNMKSMYKRAERRWKFADKNGDTLLIKDEFKDFIHPEEAEGAKEVLVIEAVEDLDKDKNGEISLEEYVNHLIEITSEDERSDPNWTQVQQDYFSTYLDKDKDGTLSNEELKEWLVPSYDRHEAEAARLISIGDENGDSKLSRHEILKKYDEYLSLIPAEFWNRYNLDDVTTVPTVHDEF